MVVNPSRMVQGSIAYLCGPPVENHEPDAQLPRDDIYLKTNSVAIVLWLEWIVNSMHCYSHALGGALWYLFNVTCNVVLVLVTLYYVTNIMRSFG